MVRPLRFPPLGLWATALLTAGAPLLPQNPSDVMSMEAESNAMSQAPEGQNTAQRARMKLTEANRAHALFEKLDAQLAGETDPARQKEIREKAQKQLGAAAADYQAALKLDPKLIDAHVGLAELMVETGRLDQAIQTLDRALEIDPKSLRALEARGRAQLAGFRVAEAKACYERIATESAKAGKSFLAEMRRWLEAQRGKLGPEMKSAVEDLDRWIREREST